MTATSASVSTVPKTVGVLLLLTALAPVNIGITAVALLRRVFAKPTSPPRASPAASPVRTVMISGGKMTKALQLARSFHHAGHRVILVEARKYRLTGHRFSRAVDRFYTVPEPQSPGYADALLDIVRAEGVDVYVPVCSPVASYHDALAKATLSPYCEVLHGDANIVRQLDDKYEFSRLAAAAGLPVPDTHRITAPHQVREFDFTESDAPYILKSIAYDPVHRLDLTPLPRPTRPDTAAFAHTKPISEANPWIMQAFVDGTEYCTHSTVHDGEVHVYCCCESSAFQLNYAMVDKPAIEEWVRTFCRAYRLTGQVSFDFIERADGALYAIECNPRTHSAITLFHDHPDLARAYLDANGPTIRPLPSSRPTYWSYQELWRLVTRPATFPTRLRTVRRGKDAIFDWSDPLPFLMVHHAHIPTLLLQNLRHLRAWIRIDFNIGKLVEPAGD